MARLEQAKLDGPLLINDMIYAEASTRYGDVPAYERALASVGVTVAPMPRDALFLAGKAFLRYRAAGGVRSSVLSDFFIGAHAVVRGLPLLTRDAKRYRAYFPTVSLIAPGEADK